MKFAAIAAPLVIWVDVEVAKDVYRLGLGWYVKLS